MLIKGEDGIVMGTVIRERRTRTGILFQIVMTNECGGRYYLVVNGEQGFHSLDLERVEQYMNSWLG